MRNHNERAGWLPVLGLFLLGLALIVLGVVCTPRFVSGQEGVSDQLALARVGASECGLGACTEGELAAIAEVLRSRCPECRLTTIARQYSSSVFDQQRTDARAWVAHLDPRGSEPRGWPTVVRRASGERAHAPWRAYRARWLRLYEMAGRVVRGEAQSACAGEVHHWGCPSDPRGACADHERAVRAGWELVECAGTRNEFWRIPERDPS